MTSPEFVRSTVLRAWDETPILRGLRLDSTALANAHTAPGQVIKIRIAEGDGPLGESYFALANPPATLRDDGAEVLVKRGSPLADAIVARAQPGASLEVTAPFGRGFPVDEARGRDLLLFAAGSGIAPVRALGEVLLARRAEWNRAVLYYGQRQIDHFAYAATWGRWRGAGIDVRLCCTRPSEDWTGARGRVQAVALTDGFGDVALARAAAFVCGPKQMVVDLKAVLAEAGLAEGRVFLNF